MSTSSGLPAAPVVLSVADRRLLDACLASAPGAWDEFVRRFGGLFAYVADRTASQRGLALPAVDRDDIVAEVLLACLANDAAVLRSFACRSSLATYLTVIARRVAVRALVASAPVVAAGDDRAAAEDGHDRVADREEVERLIERLDTTEARLVRLHHLEARSYSEISRITGLPLGSIGPALSRARDKMRGEPTIR